MESVPTTNHEIPSGTPSLQYRHNEKLPSVNELLKSPFRPSDLFSSIPRSCLHSAVLLLIKLIRAASTNLPAEQTHHAFVKLYLFPTAVLRRTHRGEHGWRSKKGQAFALRERIRRASAGHWDELWREALAALRGRQDWETMNRRPKRANNNPRSHNLTRAMRLASEGQYSRAVRSLCHSPIADLSSPDVLGKLQDLYPKPPAEIVPIPAHNLPSPPEITESEVLKAARGMNPTSAAGPDRFSPRLIRLLAFTNISPQAGVTGLSALANLVRRLAKGSLPEQTLPLFSAATLLPIQPKPGKIRPIAIGNSLRRLVTRVLLDPALVDTREFFAPEQLANGVCAGMDSIVHDIRMHMNRKGRREEYVFVSIDASNAFNVFSRQQLLDIIPSKAPSLAAFVNMIYGRSAPPLLVPPGTGGSEPHIMLSQEGTQQEDPAIMFLFTLCLQPLVRQISNECDLVLNRWYADDGNLLGPISAVQKALKILVRKGPMYQFHLNPSKTTAYWPALSQEGIANLRKSVPLRLSQENGVEILGSRIGTDEYMRSHLMSLTKTCDKLLDTLRNVPNSHIAFHLHRVCASACKVQHAFRLTPPRVAYAVAKIFDKAQMDAYADLNDVPLTPRSIRQVRLPSALVATVLLLWP